MQEQHQTVHFDQIELAVFSGRLNAICEEMGYVLMRSALSPNIKDRLDFSCAFFDREGHFCAQAAHIPVHLGSMAYAMTAVVRLVDWYEDDVLILNDPFLGGTHLPDVTVVTPFFLKGKLCGFFANRAHHANIGASSPGSMPMSSTIEEEGVVISPCKLYERGRINEATLSLLAQIEGESCGDLIPGDFMAQVSANKAGISRLRDWLAEVGQAEYYLEDGLTALNDYGRALSANNLKKLPEGVVEFIDYMDSDGFGATNIPIKLTLTIQDGALSFDFTGTHSQVQGNLNCPISVTAASIYYVILCLLPSYTPHCHGVFDGIKLVIPEGCFLNAESGAAVAAGNVETSMRIVDVVLGALSKLGLDLPAASQGTMNNVAFGGKGERSWDYYETIGGGMGASSRHDGLSAVQCHLTNSLNTPVESMEMHYPMKIRQYAVRTGSGGLGHKHGGAGIVRSYEFDAAAEVTLLTERRTIQPWGAKGGEPGRGGENKLNGEKVCEKQSFVVNKGDVLTIETPGGGGWGAKDESCQK